MPFVPMTNLITCDSVGAFSLFVIFFHAGRNTGLFDDDYVSSDEGQFYNLRFRIGSIRYVVVHVSESTVVLSM